MKGEVMNKNYNPDGMIMAVWLLNAVAFAMLIWKFVDKLTKDPGLLITIVTLAMIAIDLIAWGMLIYLIILKIKNKK